MAGKPYICIDIISISKKENQESSKSSVNDLSWAIKSYMKKINWCYGAKIFTLYCMEKHQGARTFDTNSQTSPKYILNLLSYPKTRYIRTLILYHFYYNIEYFNKQISIFLTVITPTKVNATVNKYTSYKTEL